MRLVLALVLCVIVSVSVARAKNPQPTTDGGHALVDNRVLFILSNINEQVVDEFRAAWEQAAFGASETEAVVLLFRRPDRTLKAIPAGRSNQHYKFSFVWSAGIIAIVHTHPNNCNPHPSGEDIVVARKYKVPVFTITRTGMYVYDPATGKTSMTKGALDWLELSSWTKNTNIAPGSRTARLEPAPSAIR